MSDNIHPSKVFNWLLIVAITGDFVVPYILAVFYKGYNHSLMVMSSLGNPSSPVRCLYNIWLVALGILLLLSLTVVTSKYWSVSKPLTIAVLALIIMFAVGAGILAGIFSVNESKDIVTTASTIHGIGAPLGFMALLFVPLLLGVMSYKNHDKLAGLVFVISFALALTFFVLFVLSDKPEFQNTLIKNEGLWQRLSLLFMYSPLGYIAVENLTYFARVK